MKKSIAVVIILVFCILCISGYNLHNSSNLIIVDVVKKIEPAPSIYVDVYKPVELKDSVHVDVSIVEEYTYKITYYYNNIILKTMDNILPEFDDSVTFEYSYVESDSFLPYYLYKPSSAVDSHQKFPLIVWLHGSGEKNVSESTFRGCGLPKVLDNWNLSGFNAYILCPQLAGKYNNGSWNNNVSQQYLQDLLDTFIVENNINPDKVIICGHSLGGQGCLYMAATMPNYFRACISLSPYNPGINMNNIQIPVIGYSEPGLSYAKTMQNIWGEDCMTYINTGHGNLPNAVFNLDLDNDNNSDIIEWIFGQL